MAIILFLIDTAASMNQCTYVNLSFLDLAKQMVRMLVKARTSDAHARHHDKYMLLTSAHPPQNIKAGWPDGQRTFMAELNDLRAANMSALGPAIGNALYYLNVNRLRTGIDNFGVGRFPHCTQSTVIIVITHGGFMNSFLGVHNDFPTAASSLPGSELVKEPFRWDQRMFALVLRVPGHYPSEPTTNRVQPDKSSISALCEATGGQSYCIRTRHMITMCIEELSQKLTSNGVMVCFERVLCTPCGALAALDDSLTTDDSAGGEPLPHKSASSEQSNAPVTCSAWTEMIYPLNTEEVSFWPIPEGFRLDSSMTELPARTAHPHIVFTGDPCEPKILNHLPCDRYQLQSSPLTRLILQMKQPATCFQVFVRDSNGSAKLDAPFGCLQASPNLQSVNLLVMPYKYPVLSRLLTTLREGLNNVPTPAWRNEFRRYLKDIPPYYYRPLKQALRSVHLEYLMSGVDGNFLSPEVLAYLRKVKKVAKMEFVRICLEAAQPRPPPMIQCPRVRASSEHPGKRVTSESKKPASFKLNLGTTTSSGSFMLNHRWWNSFDDIFHFSGLAIFNTTLKLRKTFKLLKAGNIRVRSLQAAVAAADKSHERPIAEMGERNEFAKPLSPALRSIELTPTRRDPFGNPFIVNKVRSIVEDDVRDINDSQKSDANDASFKSTVSPVANRKRGVLSRDHVFIPKHKRARLLQPKDDSDELQDGATEPTSLKLSAL